MKKFYAIILGLALVLALAGVAGAAVDFTGSLAFSADNEWDLWVDGALFTAAFSKEFGTAKVIANVNFDVLEEEFYLDTASYAQKVGPFTLGVYYNDTDWNAADDYAGLIVYSAPILGDAFDIGSTALRADYGFEGGAAALWTDLVSPVYYGGSVSYAIGAATLGAGFLYDNAFNFGGNVAYRVMDELTLAGDLIYDGALDLGAKATYVNDLLTANASVIYTPNVDLAADVAVKVIPDLLTVSGAVGYDATAGAVSGYKVRADFYATDNLSVYASYADAGNDYPYAWIGGALMLDGTNKVTADYSVNSNELTLGLTIGF